MRSFLAIFFLLFFWSVCPGQEIVEVVHIEKDDGLKDRIVYKLTRDNQGYFILLFKNSIQRYDGREFTNIDVSAVENENLKVEDIDHLNKLSDGTIVMCAKENASVLFYLESRGRKILSVPVNGVPLVNNGELFLLKPIDDETVSKEYKLYNAELGNHISTELLSEVKLPTGIKKVVNVDDTYYVQSVNDSVYHIENNEITLLEKQGQLIQRANGIYLFDFGAIYKITGKSTSKVVDLLDRSYNCNILKLDGEDNIIAAYSGRARIFDRLYVLDKNDSLHVMENIIDKTDKFRDFHTDDAFYRWMLGGYNGLHIINLLRDGSKFINKNPKTKKGEFGNVVSGVASDQDAEVVYCRELIGVYNYTRDTSGYEEVLVEYREEGDYERNAKMYYNKASKTYYSHAYRYDGKSDVYISDLQNNRSEKHLIPIKLNDIYASSKDQLIVGGWISKTETGIIASYDLVTKEYKELRRESARIQSIYFDQLSRTYWIGTHHGLLVFDEAFKLLKTLSKESAKPNYLDIDFIVMCSRFNDKIVAGSYGGGVFIIDPVSYEVEMHFTEENGLTDNSAIGLMNDDLGNCWITTFNGVNVINGDFEIIRKIYEHDGLPNREFNSKAIAKDGHGIIYSGTLNGLSILDPKKVLSWKKTFGIDVGEVFGYVGDNVEI